MCNRKNTRKEVRAVEGRLDMLPKHARVPRPSEPPLPRSLPTQSGAIAFTTAIFQKLQCPVQQHAWTCKEWSRKLACGLTGAGCLPSSRSSEREGFRVRPDFESLPKPHKRNHRLGNLCLGRFFNGAPMCFTCWRVQGLGSSGCVVVPNPRIPRAAHSSGFGVSVEKLGGVGRPKP